jgi:hypothetical protein
MSFKLKDKTIQVTFTGLIATVLVITFCLIAYKNPTEQSDTLKMILCLVIGSLFKSENVSHETIPTNKQ